MGLAVSAILLAVIVAVASIAPGAVISKLLRLRLPRGTDLSFAVCISQIVLYAVAFALYLARVPRIVETAALLVLAGSAALAWREILTLLRRGRNQLRLYVLLVSFGFLLLLLIRHFSGGLWGGDWVEHYERTRFFLERWPLDTRFLDLYALPARPPMMNLVCSLFLAPFGTRFELFQVAFLLLNLLVIFPLVTLVPLLGGRGAALKWLGVLLLASPVLWQNATYTWTRLYTAFFVLLAAELFFRGIRSARRVSPALALVPVAAGVATHYSAAPYAVALVVAAVAIGVKVPIRRLTLVAVVSAFVPGIWWVWSSFAFGGTATVLGNTTASGFGSMSVAAAAQLVARNVVRTIVPYPLRLPGTVLEETNAQPNILGRVRDLWFYAYQQNLVIGIGITAGAIALVLLIRAGRKTPTAWTVFLAVSAFLGIAASATDDLYGQAHICLQPLILLGSAFVAATAAGVRPVYRMLLVFGAIVDFAMGVLLQVHVERGFATLVNYGGRVGIIRDASTLSNPALYNMRLKFERGLVFLGDHTARIQPAIEVVVIVAFVLWIARFAASGALRRSA